MSCPEGLLSQIFVKIYTRSHLTSPTKFEKPSTFSPDAHSPQPIVNLGSSVKSKLDADPLARLLTSTPPPATIADRKSSSKCKIIPLYRENSLRSALVGRWLDLIEPFNIHPETPLPKPSALPPLGGEGHTSTDQFSGAYARPDKSSSISRMPHQQFADSSLGSTKSKPTSDAPLSSRNPTRGRQDRNGVGSMPRVSGMSGRMHDSPRRARLWCKRKARSQVLHPPILRLKSALIIGARSRRSRHGRRCL
ncbi:hypothetical protein FB451DRAFT_1563673 [Mycena latifolia]|nr:hypothetical protein FB451DRAFT_1563673 [Mycena latifolia]